MIRSGSKNHGHVAVAVDGESIGLILEALKADGATTLTLRKQLAARAFARTAAYDAAVSAWFAGQLEDAAPVRKSIAGTLAQTLRYGENPHQVATFYGNLENWFTQLNGKELSYNNLVDVDAAIALIKDLPLTSFAIIKHTNVCGVAQRATIFESWQAALAGDPESAFGGVLVTNAIIDLATAEAIQEIFFEVLIAPEFEAEALTILSAKKNRILLQSKPNTSFNKIQQKSILNVRNDKYFINYANQVIVYFLLRIVKSIK